MDTQGMESADTVEDIPVRPSVPRQSSSHSRSGLRLSKHHRERAGNDEEGSPNEQVPLVESTNALSVQEFVTRYIDQARLRLDISPTQDNATSPSDIQAQIHIHSSTTIPSLDFEGCFQLIETTSSDDYKASSIGWSPTKKRQEMRLPDMRFMVVRGRLPAEKKADNSSEGSLTTPPSHDTAVDEASSPATTTTTTNPPHSEVLGFLSFMTTYEDGKEVLYCYELHVHPSLQGRGIGRYLMVLFEQIASRIGLTKAMLTVFKANVVALTFYERLGYKVDEFSPEPRRLRNGTVKESDYMILSKVI